MSDFIQILKDYGINKTPDEVCADLGCDLAHAMAQLPQYVEDYRAGKYQRSEIHSVPTATSVRISIPKRTPTQKAIELLAKRYGISKLYEAILNDYTAIASLATELENKDGEDRDQAILQSLSAYAHLTTPRDIDRFEREYAYLSTEYECSIDYHDHTYSSVAEAFEANRDDADANALMTELNKCKFIQHPDLMQSLLTTSGHELVYGNYKHDTHWGVDIKSGVGRNKLGYILMGIRSAAQKED